MLSFKYIPEIYCDLISRYHLSFDLTVHPLSDHTKDIFSPFYGRGHVERSQYVPFHIRRAFHFIHIGKIEILCEDIKESKYIATYMYVPPFCCIMFLEKSDLGILPLSGIPSGSLLFVAFNNWDLSKSKLYLQQIYNEQMITHDENYLLQDYLVLRNESINVYFLQQPSGFVKHKRL